MIQVKISTDDILELLEQGTVALEGLVPWGSNYTFLIRVCNGDKDVKAIYKPRKGERPLWDFTRGTLHQRERAAFLISEGLGWRLVPPTVVRDGPHGDGSVQYFVDHDPDRHYFTFEGQYPEQVQRIVLLDAIINNADRKSGHVLLDASGRLWAIDHGVCFHSDPKLRSVIWEYASLPIPPDQMESLERLRSILLDRESTLRRALSELLSKQESNAVEHRLAQLIEAGIFPQPGPGRHYPWPMV
jgi:uncharacterized repeat protein (TIGR03843 family)